MLVKLLPALAAATLLLPAASAQAACPEPAAVADDGARVVVCQDGKERTIARGVASGDGTRFLVARRTRTRLALLKTVTRGKRVDQVVELRTWPRMTTVYRRTTRYRDRDFAPVPELELAERGSLAWEEDIALYARGTGGRVTRVTTNSGPAIALAPEGTLVWGEANRPHLRDLQTLKRGADGCRIRPSETLVHETPTARLTRFSARTAPEDVMGGITVEVLRHCTKGSGAERVLPFDSYDNGSYRSATIVGTSGQFVFATWYVGDRGSCDDGGLDRIDLATGARTTIAPYNHRCHENFKHEPVAGAPLVATPAGTPAWLRDGVLRTVNPEGWPVELDRGAITDLVADGRTIRWKRDGVDRSAAL